MVALAGSVALAVNAAGTRAATVAVTPCGISSRAPSVQRVFAMPCALVCDVAGLTAPFAALTAQVTVLFGTGLPNESATRTAKDSASAVPSVPCCASPVAFVTE
jgi:hypothetical protein